MTVIATEDLVGLIASPSVGEASCAGPAAGATVKERLALFYADPRTDVGRAQVERAVTICESCPGQLACAEFALLTRQKFGTWGGMGEVERRKLFRLDARGKRRARAAA